MLEPKIILFSESAQFLDVTKRSLELYEIGVQECINKFSEISADSEYKNKIYVVQLPPNNKEKGKEVINFFNQKKLNWICVGESSVLNFYAMTKGAKGNILLKQTPTKIEFKVFIRNLVTKIKDSIEITNLINSKTEKNIVSREFKKIIAIGASTGGTEAIQSILKKLNENIPPIVIVIHMPPGFTRVYATRLNESCKMVVKEAEDGDALRYGVAYIAPGGYHMRVVKKKKQLFLSCVQEEKVNGHIPSVDVLFESIAENVAPDVVSVILTGMGNDGALGTLNIKNKGGFTIGQDKDSCVVYGMPKVANDIGGVCVQASLNDIPKIIKNNL